MSFDYKRQTKNLLDETQRFLVQESSPKDLGSKN
jgi:hypothetical protein